MVLSPTATRVHLTKDTATILTVADRHEPRLRDKILSGFDQMERQVPNLSPLIESGDMAAVVDALSGVQVPASVMAAIQDATLTAAVASGMPEAARFGVAMNQVNEQALSWARLNAGGQLTQSGPSLGLVQDLVVQGLQAGWHPDKIADRLVGTTSLLPRHADAISVMGEKMLTDGIDPRLVDRVMARRTMKLKRWRASMIARTETIRASNMGQQLVWEQAINLGYLPAATRKVWVATGDDRTCPICAVLDGQTVGVIEPAGGAGVFDISEKATSLSTSGRVLSTVGLKAPRSEPTPPAHPQCRCTIVLDTSSTLASRSPSPAIQEMPEWTPPTLQELGIPVPRDAARRELLESTIARLDTLDPAMRDRYTQLLRDMESIKINVATKSTNAIKEHGKVTITVNRRTGEMVGNQRLMLNVSTFTDDYRDWEKLYNAEFKASGRSKPHMREWMKANPPPDAWGLKSQDELFDVLVHELGHANQNAIYADAGRHLSYTQVPQEVSDLYWEMMYSGNANWRDVGSGAVKLNSYVYGSRNADEMIAELTRFYLNGVKTPAGGLEGDVFLTAAEWRAQNPRLAEWIREAMELA